MLPWIGLMKRLLRSRRPHAALLRSAVVIALAIGLLLPSAPKGLASEEAALWRALASGGHAALLRHALAPGTGDPPAFELGNCETQRNLSVEGRGQAARIGARLRGNGILKARVFSSQWCRCLETARLLDFGPLSELPVLNSFYRRIERREQQTEGLRQWLVRHDFDETPILVTHQVNITALTDIYPTSGEIVVVRVSNQGEITVLGTIETN